MGNKPIAPPPTDFRIERVKKTFKLPEDKLEALWVIFLHYDKEKKARISTEDLLSHILKYRPNPLTDSMLKLIDSSNDGLVTFGEFVELICTFCFFEQEELMRYFFYILDPQQTGLIKKNELKHMLYKINNGEQGGSMREAFQYLDYMDENALGMFNFRQLISLKNKYPNTFHPLYFLQTQFKANSLGEFWWNNHVLKLHDEKQEVLALEMKKKRRDEQELQQQEGLVNERLLKIRMGPFKYYCMPWLRAKEMQRLQRIAAIEQELEGKMDV